MWFNGIHVAIRDPQDLPRLTCGRFAGTPASNVARDVNGDSVDDLAVAAGLASVFVLTNAGDGTFGAATPYDSGLAVAKALVPDGFDLDGSPDLAFGARLILNSASGRRGSTVPAGVVEQGRRPSPQ